MELRCLSVKYVRNKKYAKNDLKKHIEIHKFFASCDYCNYYAPTRDLLVAHMEMHTKLE